MDGLDAYNKLSYYEGVCRKRGLRDPEDAAVTIVVRILDLLRRGQTIDRRLERLIISGFISDRLRDELRTVPLNGEHLEALPGPHVPAPAIPDLDSYLFSRSLTEALLAMPPRMAEAWILVNLNGLTQAEAAEHMGTSQQRVQQQAERARLRLAETVVA